MDKTLELSVSQFVDLFNQTMDLAYPSVVITGELANFRISRNKWVYFDLKDDYSSLKFFGTVYQLPGPLEEGLMLKVRGQPRLHNLYGFSLNVINIRPTGEGSIKKAADLLKQQLAKEGLFEEARKRQLPYPPEYIGLITSKQSAAYADFIKIINVRWPGVKVRLIDVQVQGEAAPSQIVSALEQFNSEPELPEVIVVIRGGGSAEDLVAFNTEEVTRAIASSRVPTMVAIGHEIDVSLAELAADKRASTPSNAAELLVPEQSSYLKQLEILRADLDTRLINLIKTSKNDLSYNASLIHGLLTELIKNARTKLDGQAALITAYNPEAVLRRGYAIVKNASGTILRTTQSLKTDELVAIRLNDGSFDARVDRID